MNEQEQLAYDYWSKYHWAIDPAAHEVSLFSTNELDYKKYLPLYPSHPRAWIPNWVRYAKRQSCNFTCPITGWKETDFFQDTQGRGPIRMVGKLTMDHIVPGASGGLTTDDNIRAISELANTKKGSLAVSDDELRERLHNSHQILNLESEVKEALLFLMSKNISHFRMGR
jgi:hypothetical protein